MPPVRLFFPALCPVQSLLVRDVRRSSALLLGIDNPHLTPEGIIRTALPGVRENSIFQAIRWNEEFENPAPEGRTTLAQRFSAGLSGRNDASPVGTTQFSRTFYSPAWPWPHLALSSLKSGLCRGAPHLSRFLRQGGDFDFLPRTKFIDLTRVTSDNRILFGAVSRRVRQPRRPSKLPQTHFQPSFGG